MTNENVTVEQACKGLAKCEREMHKSDYGEVWSFAFEVGRCKRSIRAAHKREIAKRDELINKLADALKKIDDNYNCNFCKHFTSTEHCSKCEYLENCIAGIAHNTLAVNESEIALARQGMKREEKREKMYEYGTMWHCDKSITRHSCLKDAMSAVQLVGKHKMHIVRRPVGEWEEVKDGR